NSPYCVFKDEGTTLKITRKSGLNGKGAVKELKRVLEIKLADGAEVDTFFDIADGAKFKYSLIDQRVAPVKARRKNGRRRITAVESQIEGLPKVAAKRGRKKRVVAEKPEQVFEDALGDGPIRKSIKDSFMKLSAENRLGLGELRRLTSPEYSQQTFGIRTPIFKETDSKSNLDEKRTVNGKVKYWKELFKYNNRTYLVFKEWNTTLHRDRFNAWLFKVEEESEKKKKKD
ncbi:MAG: hypothetical protein FWF03_06725, partial [Defluviitaleaceae bacterium]|nr:hypothetical protein [Defluviitaleaceae bacterium]